MRLDVRLRVCAAPAVLVVPRVMVWPRGRVRFDEFLDFRVSQTVEVRVLKSLNCCQSLLWLHRKKAIHQTNGFAAHLAHVSLLKTVLLADFRELEANEARIRVELVLKTRWQFAHDFLNAEQLVDFRLTREDGVSVSNLSHDTANGPNVNLAAILGSQQQLWGPIPPSGYVIGQAHVLLKR